MANSKKIGCFIEKLQHNETKFKEWHIFFSDNGPLKRFGFMYTELAHEGDYINNVTRHVL